MPRMIIKVEEKYFEYSTISDRPTTSLLTREEMIDILSEDALYLARKKAESRIEDADKFGSSSRESFEEAIICNRFGKDEGNMSPKEFIKKLKTIQP